MSETKSMSTVQERNAFKAGILAKCRECDALEAGEIAELERRLAAAKARHRAMTREINAMWREYYAMGEDVPVAVGGDQLRSRSGETEVSDASRP